MLAAAVERLALSARAYGKVLRVARTIADLDGADAVRPAHVAEAIGLRVLDRGGLAGGGAESTRLRHGRAGTDRRSSWTSQRKERGPCWSKSRTRCAPSRASWSAVEKQFGKGAVMTLGDDEEPEPVATIPTGSLALDLAHGDRRLPARAASSRSTAPSRAARRRSRSTPSPRRRRGGGVAAFIDAEHALDVAYARGIGVETEQAARLAARHRRAGARHHRDARAQRRGRPGRHRLGGGAHAEGRARGRDGRRAHGPAGAAHEPGAAQAHGGGVPQRARR